MVGIKQILFGFFVVVVVVRGEGGLKPPFPERLAERIRSSEKNETNGTKDSTQLTDIAPY